MSNPTKKSMNSVVTRPGLHKASEKRMSVIGNNKFGHSEIHSIGPAKGSDIAEHPLEEAFRLSVPPSLGASLSELFEQQREKRTLYIFFQHGGQQKINHSLYTVEIPSKGSLPPIPSPESLKSQIDNPTPIHPTLLFHNTNFSSMMHCVQLDSKLYFVGGQTQMDLEEARKLQHPVKGNQWERYHPYPPYVYIFDPATITITITNPNPNPNPNPFDVFTLGPSMKTGKPNHMLLFVAYGKIYAISSPFVRLPDFERFEVFDPKTNTWAVLPPPPFYEPFIMQHAVVKRKVYIMGGDHPSSCACPIHCFDLDKKEWVPSSKLKFPTLRRRYSIVDFVEDTLYGCFNQAIIAFGPVKNTDEDGDGQFFKREVHFSQEGPLNSCMLCPMMVNRTRKLIHLGNKHFCHVVSGNPPLPALPEDPLPALSVDPKSDPHTLYISLTIFEALSDTFIGEDGRTYSKAKFLHSAHFVANTLWDSDLAILSNCFLAHTGLEANKC